MKVSPTWALLALPFLMSSPVALAENPWWSDQIEGSRTYVRDEVVALSDQIDDFFDNARRDEQRRSDYVRLGAEVRLRKGEPARLRQRFKLGVNLDAISDRLRLVATGASNDRLENGRTLPDQEEGDDFLSQQGKDSGSTALRYMALKGSGIQLDFDGGVRFNRGLNPFGQARFSHKFILDEVWSIEPSQFLIWKAQDGFGEKTRLDFNRAITPSILGRSRSEAVVSETSRGADLYQEFSLTREISSREYVSFLLTGVAYTDPAYVTDEYRVAWRYRRSLGWSWLLGEVEPAMVFPNDREHKATPEIIFRVDVYLDRNNE